MGGDFVALKIFVSSEMKSHADNERRAAAIDEIKDLGHFPIVFEEWPARPLPDGFSVVGHCEEKVASSDILIIIVDDEISRAMVAEYKSAIKNLGPRKIFYYFTKQVARENSVKDLWQNASDGYILKEFVSVEELRKQIKRSIASYMEDVLKPKQKISEIILDTVIKLEQGKEHHQPFECEKGEVITITCIGNADFYAGFYSREQYIQRRSKGVLGVFNFPPFTDSPEFTKKVTIPEDDDYYLVLRVGALGGVLFGATKINVKVRGDRYE